MRKIFIGVDPGQSKKEPGALAYVQYNFDDIEYFRVVDWSSKLEMADHLLTISDTVCSVTMESVSAKSYAVVDKKTGRKTLRSQKGTANFKFGENFGWYQGAFDMLRGLQNWPEVQFVRPVTWQQYFGLPSKVNKHDKPSLEKAREIFPSADLRLKKHHGRADALLIALYGAELFHGRVNTKNRAPIGVWFDYEKEKL